MSQIWDLVPIGTKIQIPKYQNIQYSWGTWLLQHRSDWRNIFSLFAQKGPDVCIFVLPLFLKVFLCLLSISCVCHCDHSIIKFLVFSPHRTAIKNNCDHLVLSSIRLRHFGSLDKHLEALQSEVVYQTLSIYMGLGLQRPLCAGNWIIWRFKKTELLRLQSYCF